jgi:DNA-binding XRE family transcriptional regulator
MSVTDWRQSIRLVSLEERTLVLALGVVFERITRLTQEDRDDLFELFKEFGNSPDPEDRQGLCDSIMEILEQAPPTLIQMPLQEYARQSDRWTNWIGTRLRESREKQGLTQLQVSERSGLTQSHISRIESGKHSPSRVTLEKLAQALDRPLSCFDFN